MVISLQSSITPITTSLIESSLEDFVNFDAPSLPLPGSGDTWVRFSILAELASRDLSLGRLCEGQADVLAIGDALELGHILLEPRTCN